MMIVRFGYVAMSTLVRNASPSKTMTATQFRKITDREAGIRKLERIAAENLHNTLRLLRHNRAYDIRLYRMSSRLIPLWGIEMLQDWDPMPALVANFQEVGEYAKLHAMRLSFHPDHFTVLSTPKPEVLRNSIDVLDKHVMMLEALGLDRNAKCNIHIGGTYGDKAKALARFVEHFEQLRPSVKQRMTLENDDKTFTAKETLGLCEEIHVPMVLDLHHHQINNEGEPIAELWPRIVRTWENQGSEDTQGSIRMPILPPKIHVSNPKSEKDRRAHADHVEASSLLEFLRSVAASTPYLDIMIEAKQKDGALFRLMEELPKLEGVKVLDQASVEIEV